MKKLIIALFALSLSIGLSAQGYDTALGLRLGTEWGLTLQQRFTKNTTLEGIIQSGLNRNETTLIGLIERHYPIGPRNINIYVGAGLHKGWAKAENGVKPYKDPFGVTGIGGAEVSIGKVNVAWDFKPAINLSGGEQVIYSQTAVSIRYIINKRKVLNVDKWKEKQEKRKKERQKQKDKNKKEGINWKIWENF